MAVYSKCLPQAIVFLKEFIKLYSMAISSLICLSFSNIGTELKVHDGKGMRIEGKCYG